ESQRAGSQAAESQAAESQAAESQAAESRAVRGQAAESQAAESRAVRGQAAESQAAEVGSPMAGSVARLRTNHRFSGALAELASAVQAGDAERVIDVLRGSDASVTWLDYEAEASTPLLRAPVTEWTGRLIDPARQGDRTGALEELGRHRVLCAHRRGADGVSEWNGLIERWLSEDWPDLAGEGAWYAGRPVMVTSNDYNMRLFNGDTGVTVAGQHDSAPRVSVVFEDAGGLPRPGSPSWLADVETVFAMTIHKSQGSEVHPLTLLLPPSTSRLLTRELLY